jgi:tryptophan synthase alpha chain
MNRITELFKTKKNSLLSIFYTAGFPQLNDTLAIAKHLEEAGADLIEMGIPFSDPVADGPVIQESNKIALDNGMTVKILLEQVKEIRKTVKLPILLMGYLNPVLQYGVEKFCQDAAAAGVDGLILPDLPLAEFQEQWKSIFEKHHLSNIFLISPTTSEARIRDIDAASTGFVYAVSASATTGAKVGFSQEQVDYFARLGAMKLSNPLLIGFGISNAATFQTASQHAAGAIVGSAFITLLKNSKDLSLDIREFINSLRK